MSIATMRTWKIGDVEVTRYDNRYCWVVDIKDGQIFAVREYMDTAYSQSLQLQ